MNKIVLNLDTLINPEKEDSISGRTFGQGYSEKENILEKLEKGYTFKIIISDKIKFVNDSFWKGFFNQIFKKYRSKEKVLELFCFEAKDPFVECIMENLDVLEAIYSC